MATGAERRGASPAYGAGGALADLLRHYRAAAGLTQEELAERSGLSREAISLLERGGRRRPQAYTLHKLAAALALSERDRACLAAAARTALAVAATPVPMTTAPTPALVGRRRELALLERHLAAEGPPVLLWAGEPGIGKTRLLHAALTRAAGAGYCALAGGCQRQGGQEPYAPLLGALQSHLRRQRPAELGHDLQGCAWLVRLLPELAAGPIEPLPGWTLPPAQERRLMFEAVGRFLTNVAGLAGTLLLLDDLQWAGPDALDLLTALARSTPEVPLRIVGAYRETEVPPQHPLAVLLADLAHAGLAAQRRLGPLSPEEAGQVLATLLPDALEGATLLRERVVQRTGGVPFYLVSYAQALRLGELEGGPTAVPWDVAQSIRQRVASLPPAAQEVLGAAAVAVGRLAHPALLTAVVDYPEREVLAAVEAAWRARLLEEADGAHWFAHDLVREVVEADLSAARRMVLHRRVAETLEQGPGAPPVEALAYHYGRCGDQERAVRYLEQAGDRAAAQFAHTAAQGYYHELVQHLDKLGRGSAAAQAREKLGTHLRMVARYDAALGVLEQAASTYRAAGDLAHLGQTMAEIGRTHAFRGTLDEGLGRLQPLLAPLEAQGPSPGLAALYAAVAHLFYLSGRYTEQLAAAERAAALARTVKDDRVLAQAELRRGLALALMGRDTEAREVLEGTMHVAEAVGDLESLRRALSAAATMALDRGEVDRSRLYSERGLAVAERLGDPVQIALMLCDRGLTAFLTGEWAQARADFDHAVTLSRQSALSLTSAYALGCLGRLRLAEGAWDEATRHLEEYRAIAAQSGDLEAQRWVQPVLAERDVLEGNAAVALARLVPLLGRPGLEEPGEVFLLPYLAWAHLELGEVAAAEEVVTRAGTRARAWNLQFALVDVLRMQAMVAIRQGHGARAARSLEEGLSVARDLPYPYAEGRLLHVYGHMHVATDEPGLAREQWEAALVIFRHLGARKDAERVEQALNTLLSALPRDAPVPARPFRPTRQGVVAGAPAGRRLSRRERHAWALERLRAAGPLSPRAYATALAVSVDTALRDLQELVRRGLVRAAGTTKDRRYVLADEAVGAAIHRTAP